MEKIKRFVECTIPISKCNLRCSYCYVIQQNRRNTNTSVFRCEPEIIGKAFSQQRWGGVVLVNLCAFGETLFCQELPDIVYYILKQGHYINITNNGTVTGNLKKILRKTQGMHSRLCFAFSLHYIELKKRNMLDLFAENVKMVKNEGCSYVVQLNLADEYIECLDEIKEYALKNFGALPQIALTRKEAKGYSIFTKYTDDEYYQYGNSFKSPLFSFTFKNFRVKRKEFCYAGDWSYKLDLASGELRSCYFCRPFYNIYEDLNEKIKTNTVGNNCGSAYCINSSHFMSLGVIPEIQCPSYVSLRDRDNTWYTPEMRLFLSGVLSDNNNQYNLFQKYMANKRFKTFLGKRTTCNFKRRIKGKVLRILRRRF